jgi:hypothetical protein
MQTLLNALATWCDDNCMTVNPTKSNVVQFRTSSVLRSSTEFECGDNIIHYANCYAYLGLVLNEFLDHNITAKAVAASANRVLCLVIAKCKVLGGVTYHVFTKLYDSLVSPIIEYGASIWGYKNLFCINTIHNRACQFFLGVGKYTPNAAVTGDMGWLPFFHKQWKRIIRLWCRLNNMTSDRLNRKVFVWSNCMSLSHKCVKNLNCFVNKTFCDLNLSHFCNISQNVYTTFIVNSVMSRLFDTHVNDWHNCLSLERSVSGRGGNKPRTY